MRVYELYFSPTGGTKKVADILASALSDEVKVCDVTVREKEAQIDSSDLCVIAVPSFGGRVPALAAERIKNIKGNGAKAVLVCVYGNRAYEDTLAELQDVTTNAGFSVIGAVAAVAEHSIARQFAAGRPDGADEETLHSFAKQILQKLEDGKDGVSDIPGHRPYKKTSGAGVVPKPTKQCVNCGICAANCPVGAIDKTNAAKVDKELCISCIRCISVCPHHARQISPLMQKAVSFMLKKSCSDRKQDELFL